MKKSERDGFFDLKGGVKFYKTGKIFWIRSVIICEICG